MFSTAVGILAAVALLMPGFIIVELSLARSVRSAHSDLELGLRALAYALVVHLLFGFWTAHLVKTLGAPQGWVNHIGAISAYVAVVLLAVPVTVGVALNRYLAEVEARDLPLSLFAAGLGSGQARDAFDYAYQRWREEGVWVIVELIGHSPESPRLVGGVFGRHSAVGQTPQPHDIYLEALYTVDEDINGVRNISDRIDPQRGVYIAASQIVRIDLVPEAGATLAS